MADTVNIGETAEAIAALETEKLSLFSDASSITEEQHTLLQAHSAAMRSFTTRHRAVLTRIIAIEEAQVLLLRNALVSIPRPVVRR